MTEPVASAAVATAAGITLLGVATGLQPQLLVAGAAGGWWAVTYLPPSSALSRINRVLISAAVAAWGAPAAVGIGLHNGWIPAIAPVAALEMLAALGIGLLTIDVLGGGALAFARRWIGRREGGGQ